jgi:hypothetical protein
VFLLLGLIDASFIIGVGLAFFAFASPRSTASSNAGTPEGRFMNPNLVDSPRRSSSDLHRDHGQVDLAWLLRKMRGAPS